MQLTLNEILYKIKKSIDLTNSDIIKAYELENFSMSEERLESLLVRRNDDNFQEATFEEIGIFLDGLVTLKRGPSKQKASNEAVELTNNLILKKLRIALELKDPQIEIIFALADVELTKQQLSSLFRKESHKNFKVCSDELLLSFLDGLDEYFYVGEEV